jgi:hypothetical protein
VGSAVTPQKPTVPQTLAAPPHTNVSGFETFNRAHETSVRFARHVNESSSQHAPTGAGVGAGVGGSGVPQKPGAVHDEFTPPNTESTMSAHVDDV